MANCYCECDPYAFWKYNWHKYSQMSSIQRMEYLRSLRLQITADIEKEKREERYREMLYRKWLKE
jgi:hypothetical protein